MDSGHPLFLLLGSELAFVCPARGFYSDDQATGFLCAYYGKLIQKAIDGLNLQLEFNPMAIEDFDFSECHESSGGGP